MHTVLVKNKQKYPIRIRIGSDEKGGGIYRALNGFERFGPLTVEMDIFQNLMDDQRVMVSPAN